MKKLLKVCLALIMCLLLCACSNSNNTNTSDKKIYLKLVEDGKYDIVCKDSKTFSKYIKKVEITKENWKQYFEDYERVDHVVKKNTFGEIEEEYDLVHLGFGLKKNILGFCDIVGFKFDGKVEYSSYQYRPEKISDVKYNVYELNKATYIQYSYETKELIEEKELKKEDIETDHYYVEIKYDREEDKVHLTKFNCIDAIGDIYYLDLPEGFYNGEKINQIVWESGGGAGFGVGNFKHFYNN